MDVLFLGGAWVVSVCGLYWNQVLPQGKLLRLRPLLSLSWLGPILMAILEGGPSLQEEKVSYQKRTVRLDELMKIRMPIKFGIPKMSSKPPGAGGKQGSLAAFKNSQTF